jgi:hypothetical protein
MINSEPARRRILRRPSSDPRQRTVFTSADYAPSAEVRDATELPIHVPSSENPDADARAVSPSERGRPR